MATTKSYREGFEGIEWDKYIYNRLIEESKVDNTAYAARNAPQKRKG
jgi:hypothetical protein